MRSTRRSATPGCPSGTRSALVTWCPCSARYGATCLPALPLPPVKKMRMASTTREGLGPIPTGPTALGRDELAQAEHAPPGSATTACKTTEARRGVPRAPIHRVAGRRRPRAGRRRSRNPHPCRRSLYGGRKHHGDDVAWDGLRILRRACNEVAGTWWQGRTLLPPSRTPAVEARGALGVAGLQYAHRPRAGLVDDLCALALAGLSCAEGCLIGSVKTPSFPMGLKSTSS